MVENREDLLKLRNERNFQQWLWERASAEERQLYEIIVELSEEFFPDFRFESGTIIDDFIKAESSNDDGRTWFDETIDAPDVLPYFDDVILQTLLYKVEPLANFSGCFDRSDLSITIIPEELDNRATILHELIHIYEFALDLLPKFYHDILLLCLYNDLRSKVSDLDDKVKAHTHVIYGEQITARGGNHDILFLFKSLDLDLKNGYKLGTVCGYGREEVFNGGSDS